jgi:hypothetical protein
MNSGITGISRAGHGKLSPIPPEDVDFDVFYDIALEFERGLDWSNLPLAKEVRTTISVKPFFDEIYLPDGTYQLQTEKATWQVQRRAGRWELSEDSLRNIIGTKLRFVSLEEAEALSTSNR